MRSVRHAPGALAADRRGARAHARDGLRRGIPPPRGARGRRDRGARRQRQRTPPETAQGPSCQVRTGLRHRGRRRQGRSGASRRHRLPWKILRRVGAQAGQGGRPLEPRQGRVPARARHEGTAARGRGLRRGGGLRGTLGIRGRGGAEDARRGARPARTHGRAPARDPGGGGGRIEGDAAGAGRARAQKGTDRVYRLRRGGQRWDGHIREVSVPSQSRWYRD
mmetsp:Transcript_11251/g.24369  ORF Transcript_11251/g.24369 Transcript_11251/m.24369 type:complete len:222 (+) Transcript_11251:1113-1778(+)